MVCTIETLHKSEYVGFMNGAYSLINKNFKESHPSNFVYNIIPFNFVQKEGLDTCKFPKIDKWLNETVNDKAEKYINSAPPTHLCLV